MRIQTRRVNNGTSFFKQQGTLSKKISVRDAGVFGKSVNPIRNRGQIACHITTSFVFWENLRRANLRSVLSEL